MWLLQAPVSGEAASGVAPDPGLAAFGVAAFDKVSAPAAISEVAQIAPHEFVPGPARTSTTRLDR